METRALLEYAMTSDTVLDERERRIVELRVWDGLTYDELSYEIGRTRERCREIFIRSIYKLYVFLSKGHPDIIAAPGPFDHELSSDGGIAACKAKRAYAELCRSQRCMNWTIWSYRVMVPECDRVMRRQGLFNMKSMSTVQ